MPEYTVLISIDERFAASVDEERLEAVARRALELEKAPPCQLEVTVTDDETVRRLNREYADEDEVTDVLSFSQVEGEEFVRPPGEARSLGEVIIAYPYAERQATGRISDAAGGDTLRPFGQAQDRKPQGERIWEDRGEGEWSVQREIEWLVAHGTLHLLGYDHEEPEEERRMRSREVEALGC